MVVTLFAAIRSVLAAIRASCVLLVSISWRICVTVGALREAVRRGNLGEDDRVVLLVTGDGLKTPAVVADRLEPTRVEPDADLILEKVGVNV